MPRGVASRLAGGRSRAGGEAGAGLARYLPQPPSIRGEGSSGGLWIHARDLHRAAENLVIFVHGWGGDRYDTWGELPQFTFDGGLKPDVGVFDYVSGFRRFPHWGSPRPIDVAKYLADEISELPHRRVFLVGHSMGGLVCQAAIRHLFNREASPYSLTSRVAALVALATPRKGSWLARRQVPLGRDRSFLLEGQVHQELSEFFGSWVEVHLKALPTKPLSIPTFAGVAINDHVVRTFSAANALPTDQIHRFLGGHGSFVKLEELDPALHEWLDRALAASIEAQTAHRRFRELQTRGALVANYCGQSVRSDWHEAYLDACEEVGKAHAIGVVSATTDQPLRAHIVIRVLPADEATDRRHDAVLRADAEAQEKSSPRTALGVAPFGGDHDDAVAAIAEVIGQADLRWITGTDSLARLRQEFVRWLRLTAAYIQGPSTTASYVGAVDADLPSSYAETQALRTFDTWERP